MTLSIATGGGVSLILGGLAGSGINCEIVNQLADGFLLAAVFIGKNPCAAPEETDRRCADCPVTVCSLACFFTAAVRSQRVVDQPCRTEESENRLLSFAFHICEPGIIPVLCIIGISVVFQFLGIIKESFPLRSDMKFSVNQPALIGTVLDCVPDISVTGNDAIAFCL